MAKTPVFCRSEREISLWKHMKTAHEQSAEEHVGSVIKVLVSLAGDRGRRCRAASEARC